MLVPYQQTKAWVQALGSGGSFANLACKAHVISVLPS